MIARLFAVLVVGVALGCSVALADPPVVKFVITKDGTFSIDGQRYSGDAALRTKINELAAENPQPSFVIATEQPSAPSGIDQIKIVGEAILILQKAGVAKFGIIIQLNPNQDNPENNLGH